MAPAKRQKAPAKPILYFDVGALVVERNGLPAKAAFGQGFLDGVKGRFRLRLLSALEEHVARARLKPFYKFEPEYMAYRHALGKASAIDFRAPFYWIDEDPTPADLLRLADERASDRVITITKRDGATEQTLKKLLSTLEEHAAAGAEAAK